MGWWDTASVQGGQAHFLGPTVLTQQGEVHPEVPHSSFPFFLKTIVSPGTRQGIHQLKCRALWKAPVKGHSGLVPPTPSPSLPELTSHISGSSPRGVLCMFKQILCTFLFLPIFAEKAASPHTLCCFYRGACSVSGRNVEIPYYFWSSILVHRVEKSW